MTPLDRALQDLIDFLTDTRLDEFWLRELTSAQRAMAVPERRAAAVAELRTWFGGMGTLNDLWMAPARGTPHGDADELNAELGRRLDALHDEIGLEGRPWMRMLLGWVGRPRSTAVPPRVLGAIAVRPPPGAPPLPGTPESGWWRRGPGGGVRHEDGEGRE